MTRLKYLIMGYALLLAGSHNAFANQSMVLGSGKSIEIIAVGPLKFSQGSAALMLKYRTAIAITDMASLRKEASEIWDRFMVDVERAGYQQLSLVPTNQKKGASYRIAEALTLFLRKKTIHGE